MNLFTDKQWEFKVSKDRPLKLFETFAGIGSQTQALKNLGIPHEIVAISEIDKYAIMSYEAIHGKTNNLGDISKISAIEIPDHDLLTYSFPCQDISIAGKLHGITKKTRSGLLWEVARILKELKSLNKLPSMLLMENVKNLLSENFKDDYYKWLQFLEDLGYSNYSKVLNAKDYGIPQNRDRVYCVSVLGNYYYEFPEKISLTMCLKDMLQDNPNSKYYMNTIKNKKLLTELKSNQKIGINPCLTPDRIHKRQNGSRFKNDGDTMFTLTTQDRHGVLIVDEKYYLSEKMLKGFKFKNDGTGYINQDTQASKVHNVDDVSSTICAGSHGYANGYIHVLGEINNDSLGKEQNRRVYSVDGISPTIQTMAGGNRQPKIIQRARGYNKGNIFNEVPAITSSSWQENNFLINNLKIRKLTPHECWRLMGFKDEQFEKAAKVCSDSQLYKQAGNSIVVPVLEAIFENLIQKE